MNKKTTLLGILGLVAVSGAGYVYTSGQASQLPQQIGQYLPETVRDYLPASFSPQQAANTANEEMAQSDQLAPVAGQEINTEAPVAQVDEVEPMLAESEDLEATQEVSMDAMPSNDMAQSDEIEGINGDIINDIEESVSELSGSNVASAEVDDAAMNEIKQLERELSEVNSQLGGLDAEKLELEDKFQNVLKQNRALAVKLKEIDEQLKVNMK